MILLSVEYHQCVYETNFFLGTTVAMYLCDDEFTLVGDEERNCTVGVAGSTVGIWTGTETTCVCKLIYKFFLTLKHTSLVQLSNVSHYLILRMVTFNMLLTMFLTMIWRQ